MESVTCTKLRGYNSLTVRSVTVVDVADHSIFHVEDRMGFLNNFTQIHASPFRTAFVSDMLRGADRWTRIEHYVRVLALSLSSTCVGTIWREVF